MLSNCKKVQGHPKVRQPVIIDGSGEVLFGDQVEIGIEHSPFYYNGYIYIEVRRAFSKITFGNNVRISNCCSFVSGGEGINIGDGTLIGFNCEFFDSDFHDLDPTRRIGGIPKTAKIVIGRNVFLGSNVKIMKGVVIGDNSIIANSSVVTKSIPENVVAGGTPAKVLRAV
jgi:maltose O-acetyltransferase